MRNSPVRPMICGSNIPASRKSGRHPVSDESILHSARQQSVVWTRIYLHFIVAFLFHSAWLGACWGILHKPACTGEQWKINCAMNSLVFTPVAVIRKRTLSKRTGQDGKINRTYLHSEALRFPPGDLNAISWEFVTGELKCAEHQRHST